MTNREKLRNCPRPRETQQINAVWYAGTEKVIDGKWRFPNKGCGLVNNVVPVLIS